jgi:putative chitinase
VGQIAYILATAEHESKFGVVDLSYAPGHNWLEEDPAFYPPKFVTAERLDFDMTEYLRKLKAHFNNLYSSRDDLGNLGGDDGYKYRGRGYVQLTGRSIYRNIGKHVDIKIDLENNPSLAIKPENAAKIIVVGMKKGLYTGSKELSYYINGEKRDFYGARVIVNSYDKAAEIADIAKTYFDKLNNLV